MSGRFIRGYKATDEPKPKKISNESSVLKRETRLLMRFLKTKLNQRIMKNDKNTKSTIQTGFAVEALGNHPSASPSHDAKQNSPAAQGNYTNRISLDGRVSLRINESNPDHHLWNNNGTWWCHFTEHLPDYTKRRVRVSLGTSDIELARQRRDEILSTMESTNRERGETPLAA